MDGEREGGVVGGVMAAGGGVMPVECSKGGSDVARIVGKGMGAWAGGDGVPASYSQVDEENNIDRPYEMILAYLAD